jgi:hypothetical protein
MHLGGLSFIIMHAAQGQSVTQLEENDSEEFSYQLFAIGENLGNFHLWNNRILEKNGGLLESATEILEDLNPGDTDIIGVRKIEADSLGAIAGTLRGLHAPIALKFNEFSKLKACLLYTSPSPRDH